ncbi:MAG: permease [Armatimonadota bacterium]|nr:permease [Armatimonadota bacterium]MDR5703341.1 permease [Armatimonadota bacterium]
MQVSQILAAGLFALKDYIASHVLTCLVPAFLLAGAIVTFVNREAILDLLGAKANKLKSFSLASGASFFLAACSCTVIPVSSGLYYGGAGIGAAFIVLWVAPASNLLALIYTGSILGGAMVLARVVAAVILAFAVGWVMSLAFRQEEGERIAHASLASNGPTTQVIAPVDLGLLGLLVVSLLAPNYLVRSGPYSQKVVVWAIATAAVAAYAGWTKTRAEIRRWVEETWWFVRLIFPLLLVGVYIVGVIGALLPRTWIEQYLGGSGLQASFLATLLGSVSYFATMTEAPFVHTLMKLGMGKGPALALLLTGPGLSLPNWLAIARVFGTKKATVYVLTIVVLGTLVGWSFGNFIF